MPPKLIALGVIAMVLWIMMMIVAPPQDTTHYSADAGDFASSSAICASLSKELLAPWGGGEFTNGKRLGMRMGGNDRSDA